MGAAISAETRGKPACKAWGREERCGLPGIHSPQDPRQFADLGAILHRSPARRKRAHLEKPSLLPLLNVGPRPRNRGWPETAGRGFLFSRALFLRPAASPLFAPSPAKSRGLLIWHTWGHYTCLWRWCAPGSGHMDAVARQPFVCRGRGGWVLEYPPHSRLRSHPIGRGAAVLRRGEAPWLFLWHGAPAWVLCNDLPLP